MQGKHLGLAVATVSDADDVLALSAVTDDHGVDNTLQTCVLGQQQVAHLRWHLCYTAPVTWV
jgi:hypothetical protein